MSSPRECRHCCVVLMLVCVSVSMSDALHKGPFTINIRSVNIQPNVRLKQGYILGYTAQSLHGRDFHAFKGIPYALPPVGELRFKPPVPIDSGHRTLNATKEGNDCIQKNYLIDSAPVSGSEDCLYLNVYTPANIGDNLLPVMVYIHGGGWFAGSGSAAFQGPEHLLDKEIILVTINYRLGVFGFLSTGDEAAPGNYGMKDQVQALRWVRDNIKEFGGNKDLVTIFGQSAGAVSTHYHMLSPLSRGLFHRVISQSGTVLSVWAWPSETLSIARDQGRFVNCNQEATSALVECLREVDANALAESGKNFHYWSIDPLVTYGPVVEPDFPNAFLKKDPMKIIRDGQFARVPWMTGVVAQEGIIRAVPIIANETLLKELNANWANLGPALFELSKSGVKNKTSQLWGNITDFYLPSKTPVKAYDAMGFIDMYSDRSFVHGTHKSVLMHAARGHDNIFLYKFDYTPAQTGMSYQFMFAPLFNKSYGVSHCDDLLYIFSHKSVFSHWYSHPADIQVVDAMVDLWTNFAKHGDPTPRRPNSMSTHQVACVRHTILSTPACEHWSNLTWDSVLTEDHRQRYLYIRNTVSKDTVAKLEFSMEPHLFEKRMAFWDNAPLVENAAESHISSHPQARWNKDAAGSNSAPVGVNTAESGSAHGGAPVGENVADSGSAHGGAPVKENVADSGSAHSGAPVGENVAESGSAHGGAPVGENAADSGSAHGGAPVGENVAESGSAHGGALARATVFV